MLLFFRSCHTITKAVSLGDGRSRPVPRNGEGRELGLSVTPFGPGAHFTCHGDARGPLQDGELGKTGDGRLTFAVSWARRKCGKQVHDEGTQARARVVPAKSLSPA